MFAFDDRTRALLAAVWRQGSVAAAAHTLGLDPSNAHRHLRTAERRLGEKLIRSRQGGRDGRNSELTAVGRRLLRLSRLRGIAQTYDEQAGVTPIAAGRRILYAAGRVPSGAVEFLISPESVTLRRPGPRHDSSARNEFPVRVQTVRKENEGTFRLTLTAGELRLEALVVRGAMRDLRIREGSHLIAIIKAVAIHVSPLSAKA